MIISIVLPPLNTIEGRQVERKEAVQDRKDIGEDKIETNIDIKVTREDRESSKYLNLAENLLVFQHLCQNKMKK